MKRGFLIGVLICFMTCPVIAQDNPLALVIDKQENKLKTLVNKPPSTFNDYSEIVTLCNKIARNYNQIALIATSESAKSANFRQALRYFSDAARFANIAAEKFDNRYMLQLSAKACKKAAEVYRTLGKPKTITFLNGTFIDTCKLLSNNEEATNSEKPKEESSTTQNYSNRRIVFTAGEVVFSVKLPRPLEAKNIFGGKANYLTTNDITKAIKEDDILGVLKSGMNQYEVSGYQISFGLATQVRNKLTEQVMEARPKFAKTRNDRTFSLGIEAFDVGSYDARLTYDWEWEVDGPIQAKEDLMASISITFKTEGHFCEFSVYVRNLDEHKIEKKVMEMVRSFRVESAVPPKPVTQCEDGTYKLLKKGIPVTWTIYDRTRPSTIIQQPVLARDYEIAEKAASYTGAVVEVLTTAKDVLQVTSIPRKVIIDGELSQALSALGGWYLEGYHKVDFIPVEFEETSNTSIDGSLTNAVIFYLKALRDVNNGLSKLGKRMENMSLRLYWEIPIIEIKGECIPRMVCKDGTWQPDRKYMEFREISRTTKTYRAPNKDFMTIKQVADDLNRYYYAKMDALEEDEINFKNVLERCKTSQRDLWKIDFPVNFDTCPIIENSIQLKQHELLRLNDLREDLKEALGAWLNILKPAEVARLNERLAEIAIDIQKKEKEIPRLETLRLNYVNNNQMAQAAQTANRIRFLREDIALLVSFRNKTNNELQKLNTGKKESEMSKELANLSQQILDIEKEKKDLKKELAKCLAEADKLR